MLRTLFAATEKRQLQSRLTTLLLYFPASFQGPFTPELSMGPFRVTQPNPTHGQLWFTHTLRVAALCVAAQEPVVFRVFQW